MEGIPATEDADQPVHLGQDGEEQFDRLRACLELGEGVEFFFCGFDAPHVLAEVQRRLASAPPPGNEFENLVFEKANDLPAIAERLAALSPAAAGRKIVFVTTSGNKADLKGAWAKGLHRLNERRNGTMRDCPSAIVLAGPSWLPWLAHDTAPDLWSVRTAIFTFLSPPSGQGKTALTEAVPWPSGMPMAHELEPPAYYEELARALESSRRPGEQTSRGQLLLRASATWRLHGDNDTALTTATKAGEAFALADSELMVAVSQGYVADILQQRGETDEALRIRREEQLPVFERLGDVRKRAITMGQIADILQQRGETDEALRIRREEQLPVYERLGDVRSRAVTMGKIADILQQRGETDEALRIQREEQLPVYERLGDVRERAITMGKIADILQQRGETDEALRIRREEELPVYEHLGDVRSRAVTMGKIAGILQQRGETDEALRIHIKERLPVAEAMQDTDSIAHVRLCCAQIRLGRDGLEKGEAQTIYEELAESFTLFKKLQRVDGIAHSGVLLGQVLAGGGHIDDALSVLAESAAAFEKIGVADQAAQIRTMQETIRKHKK